MKQQRRVKLSVVYVRNNSGEEERVVEAWQSLLERGSVFKNEMRVCNL